MQEITFNGELKELAGLKLKDKDTGDEVEFVRVGGDLIDSIYLDVKYLNKRYDDIVKDIDKTKKGLETKDCFEPIVSLEKLNKIAEAYYNTVNILYEIIEGVEND